MANTKKPSQKVVKLAAKTLNNKSASGIQKSLAASVLAQSRNAKQTGKVMEAKASKATKSTNATTQTLAGSVLSQSNKSR
jgi:hypothetical protein